MLEPFRALIILCTLLSHFTSKSIWVASTFLYNYRFCQICRRLLSCEQQTNADFCVTITRRHSPRQREEWSSSTKTAAVQASGCGSGRTKRRKLITTQLSLPAPGPNTRGNKCTSL